MLLYLFKTKILTFSDFSSKYVEHDLTIIIKLNYKFRSETQTPYEYLLIIKHHSLIIFANNHSDFSAGAWVWS